jgi:hypothetical protein
MALIFSNFIDLVRAPRCIDISITSRFVEEWILAGLGRLDAMLSGSPGLYDSGLTYLYLVFIHAFVLYSFSPMFQEYCTVEYKMGWKSGSAVKATYVRHSPQFCEALKVEAN